MQAGPGPHFVGPGKRSPSDSSSPQSRDEEPMGAGPLGPPGRVERVKRAHASPASGVSPRGLTV